MEVFGRRSKGSRSKDLWGTRDTVRETGFLLLLITGELSEATSEEGFLRLLGRSVVCDG